MSSKEMIFRLLQKGIYPVIEGLYTKQLTSFTKHGYSSDCLLVKKIGVVTCIGLNRPEQKNRFSINLVKNLKEAIDRFEKDEASPVAVLYGERGNFSYGYDLNELSENPNYLTNVEEIGLLEIFTSKPIVAAVSGFAVGFAFDVILWCDFRIVEDTAVMGGYARKFGMPISDIIAKRLYSSLGMYKALDLILSGRIVKAKEAFETGIATRIVACGTGLGQAVSFANSLANMPQACLKADRATIISLSETYSGSYLEDTIIHIKSEQKRLALEEAKKNCYVNQSEDVRKKG